MKLVVTHSERVRSAVLGGMGWLKEGGLLQGVFANAGKNNAKANAALSSCFRALSKLAVTEDEIRAVKVPVTLIVGDKDVCRALYVEPARRVRPDWPGKLIAGADHLTCIAMPDFKKQVVAAIDRCAEKRPEPRDLSSA